MPHRINAPSAQATGPRYSLVWKLVLYPKDGTAGRASLARPEWGTPLRISTGAHVSAFTDQSA